VSRVSEEQKTKVSTSVTAVLRDKDGKVKEVRGGEETKPT
jgi:hypothetical protein